MTAAPAPDVSPVPILLIIGGFALLCLLIALAQCTDPRRRRRGGPVSGRSGSVATRADAPEPPPSDAGTTPDTADRPADTTRDGAE